MTNANGVDANRGSSLFMSIVRRASPGRLCPLVKIVPSASWYRIPTLPAVASDPDQEIGAEEAGRAFGDLPLCFGAVLPATCRPCSKSRLPDSRASRRFAKSGPRSHARPLSAFERAPVLPSR